MKYVARSRYQAGATLERLQAAKDAEAGRLARDLEMSSGGKISNEPLPGAIYFTVI